MWGRVLLLLQSNRTRQDSIVLWIFDIWAVKNTFLKEIETPISPFLASATPRRLLACDKLHYIYESWLGHPKFSFEIVKRLLSFLPIHGVRKYRFRKLSDSTMRHRIQPFFIVHLTARMFYKSTLLLYVLMLINVIHGRTFRTVKINGGPKPYNRNLPFGPPALTPATKHQKGQKYPGNKKKVSIKHKWYVGSFGSCSETCNRGFKYRLVVCIDKRKRRQAHSFYCRRHAKPLYYTSCYHCPPIV